MNGTATTTAPALRQPTARERNLRDARAVARIAHEVRGMLADAPKDDPEVAEILRDCEALDRAVQLLHTEPIELKGGKLSLTTVVERHSLPRAPQHHVPTKGEEKR